jgi:copper homeostasis protein
MGDGFIFEACVDSVHSALAAQRGGAGRLELCANLLVGGTTPSYGLVKMVKEQVHIPVHVLIRPRSGHFVFSCTELKVMIEDIKMVGQLGVQGVAIGALTEDNKINVEQEDAGLAGALWSV